MKQIASGIGFVLLLALAPGAAPDDTVTAKDKLPPGDYARFDTSFNGKILIRLLSEKAPKTVANFIALAEGRKDFLDPKTGEKAHRRFFDGTLFHTIYAGSFIQGGCPLGTGTGSVGFTIPDEIDPKAKQLAGALSMSRDMSRPNTASTQFILSCAPLSHLDGQLTVFGQTVYGLQTIQTLSKQKTGLKKRPRQPLKLNHVEIIHVTKDKPLTVQQALWQGDPTAPPSPEELEAARIERERADKSRANYNNQVRYRGTLMAENLYGTTKETLLSIENWRALRTHWKTEQEKKQREMEAKNAGPGKAPGAGAEQSPGKTTPPAPGKAPAVNETTGQNPPPATSTDDPTVNDGQTSAPLNAVAAVTPPKRLEASPPANSATAVDAPGGGAGMPALAKAESAGGWRAALGRRTTTMLAAIAGAIFVLLAAFMFVRLIKARA